LLCLLLASLAAGCGGGEPTAPEPTPEPAQRADGRPARDSTSPSREPDPAASAPPPGERPNARDTATACARVRSCCSAYVAAIGDDVEAERARRACEELDRLESLGEAAGEACLSAIEGWRQSLELLGRDVPTSCR
jgi:hypothetical protein